MINKTIYIFIVTFSLILINSCGDDYTPKPHGYIRFDLPKHNYVEYKSDCPYEFEIGKYSNVINLDKCWKNIYVKPVKGTIHLTYMNVKNNLFQILEESHLMVYKHTVKADAITETPFFNRKKKVYGILYEIKGNAASNIQFIATDSVQHYLRGALYFRARPNKDSLAPLIKFMKADITHLIETLKWK